MSRMTPWGYYEAFVLHNLWDYERSPYDIRLGMNACVSAFQLADVMYFYYKRKKPDRIQPWPKKKDFLTDLSSRDLGFLTVQSVATAYKHLYTNKAFYEIESGGAMSSFRVPADDVNLEPDWESDVFVLRRDGTKTSLKGALKNVVEKLWPSVLPHDEN
jgi:hypothetical protein